MSDNTTSPEPGTDTLPEWLHQRFGAYLHGGDTQPWDHLPDHDRAYWAHEAAAVRRAVARGGFKDRTVQAEHDAQVRAAALREGDQLAAGLGRSAATYARRYEKAADRLRATRKTLARYRSTLAAVRTAVAEARACDGVDCTIGHRDVILALIDDGAPEVLPLAVAIQQRDAAYRAHNADIGRASDRQFALQKALRSPRSAAGWDYLIERAAVVVTELETARTEHEKHRRALVDALGEAPRRDWEYLIRSAGASRAEAAQRATKLAEARQLAGARRKAFADALGADQLRDWDDLLNAARGIAKDRRAQQRRAESAESASKADGRRADRAEEEAREARQGETEAVRARKAAEDRLRRIAASGPRADAVQTEIGEMIAQTHDLRDQLHGAKATLARVREIGRRLTAHAAGFQDVLDDTDRGPWARTVSADLEELRAVLGGGSEQTQPDPCAHGCRDAADAHTRLSEQLDTDAREQAAEPERVPDLSIDVIVRTPLSPQQIEDAIVAAAQSGFITIRSAT